MKNMVTHFSAKVYDASMESASDSPTLPAIVKEAQWIWPVKLDWDRINNYAVFRKTFHLGAVPRKAPLLVTADQSYQLYLNGEYVCRGPARGFQCQWPYDVVDVSRWLRKGANLLAIRAHNPGQSNFQYLHQGFAGLLVAAQWGRTKILTNKEWKARRQTSIRQEMVTTSLQLFPQEVIDLRVDAPDWMLPGCNDTDWKDPLAAHIWNGMPWYSLEERALPMLDEREIQPGRVIGQANGMNAPDVLTTRNLSITRFEEGLAHQPADQDIHKIAFKRSPKNGWRSVLIDLGKLHVSSVILEINGAQGGEIVETHHYETIDKATLCPHYKPDAHSRMAFSHRLTCRPGVNRHAFYHAFGFRYLVLTVRGNSRPVTVTPTLRTATYPLQQNGSFESSDKRLKAIWETCAWTQRMCSLDAYADAWREQAQWWGDARVMAWSHFHIDGDIRLFRRGIRQIASQTTPDGVTYGHAPTMAHNCILPDFTLIWMLTLWDYYWQTESLEPFQAHQGTLRDALSYFRKWTCERTGLLRHDARYWLFLDWTDLRKEGCSSVYSLWLLHALDRLSQLYMLTGDKESASECRQWAKSLRSSLRKLLNRNGLMQEGYTEKGRIDPRTSVHAQTLALMNGLCPEHERDMLEKCLLPYLRGTLKTDIQPSAYWITYVFTEMVQRGYSAEVLNVIRRRWAPMAEHGTTWENFQPVLGEESFSHAWSAHPLFHLIQILGGIRQIGPGWKEVTYTPHFEGEHAEVGIPSPKGIIHSCWRRQGNTVQGEIKLPNGIQASLALPGQKATSITGCHAYELTL